MRIILSIFFFLFSFTGFSQRIHKVMTGTNKANLCIIPPPDTSTAKAWMVFIPGNGESKNDTSLMDVHGPLYWVNSTGWRHPNMWIIIAQPYSGNPGSGWTRAVLEKIIADHNVDELRLCLTGVSYGSGATATYVGTGVQPWATIPKPSSVILMSFGRNPTANDTRYSEIAVQTYGSLSDGEAVSLRNWYRDYIIDVHPTPEKVPFVSYSGGHGSWNPFYDPSYVNPTTGLNLYDWAMQFTYGESGTTNIPPVAVAGADQTVTLPTSSVSLSASASSDADGTISSYSWVKTSGPSGGTFSAGSSASTNFSFTNAGTYLITLTVTDNDGATATDQVAIVVNPEDEPEPEPEIRMVIPSEYKVAFIKSDSTAGAPYWSSGTRYLSFNGGHKFVDGDGGLYNILLRKANGDVYVHNNTNRDLAFLQYDTTGAAFKAIDVECYFRTYFAVRDDSTIWAMQYNSHGYFAGATGAIITKWMKIPGQTTQKFVKIHKGGETGSGQLLALDSNGEVWTLNDNSNTWVKKTLPVQIKELHAGHYGFYIAIGIDSLPYGWGQGKYLGKSAGNISTYDALADDWGLGSHKIISMGVNDNSIHYITEDHKLWGLGDNSGGNVGVGWELVNRKELYAGAWYVWNWIKATEGNYQQSAFISTPQHIRQDKLFTKVFAGNYYTHYKYAQELGTGDLYSWGRNKGAVLMSGIGASNESAIPNSMDVLVPTKVTPLTTVTPSPSTFVRGTINAGSNLTISGSSTTLSGTAVPGGTNTWDYVLTDYEWTKISGPSCVIASPSSASTVVTSMAAGVYAFQFKVTDNNTATITDTVVITVTGAGNILPSVSAGADIVGSDTSVQLIATASDTDGSIVTFAWTKLSGADGDNIAQPGNDTTTVSGLQQGVYLYQVTVTDDDGGIATDQVQITVTPVNVPPTLELVEDTSVLGFSIMIEGFGADSDGTVTAYTWGKLFGADGDTIMEPSSAETEITFTQDGVYGYRLIAFDNSGASVYKDVTIRVRGRKKLYRQINARTIFINQ